MYETIYNSKFKESIIHYLVLFIFCIFLHTELTFANSSWTIESNWDFNLTHPQFKASSVDAVNKCRLNPDSLLSFPVLLYGAQEIFLDNKSILKYGDPTFTKSNFVVGAPELKCQDLIQGKELKWIATAYSASFVKTLDWPVYHKRKVTNQFFAVYQYIGGIVGLFFVALFSFFIMYRKERTEFIIAFLGACLFISIYMIGCISPLLTNNLSMLMVHKISDISLGIGNTFLFTAFFLEKQITKKYIYFQYFSQMTGSVISLLGANGDIVQFGSTIQFISAILILIKILTANIKQLKSHYSLEY